MSTGVCELCGAPSVTWLGDTEVCERCSRAFFEEAAEYMADAVIALAEDWNVPYEDAFEAMCDAVTMYEDLCVEERLEADRDKALALLKAGAVDLPEIRRITGESQVGLLRRLRELQKRGLAREKNGVFVAEGNNGEADAND